MKQQIIAIHGGTSFNTYEDYISFLKTRELTPERLRYGRDWKSSLSEKLDDVFEVFVPKMPNGANARYLEWRIWFERCASLLAHESILIGHSLGGIFLAKYLSENDFSKTIKATILIAAPFNDDDLYTPESLKDFALPDSLEKFNTQGGMIYLIHSKDDPVVPFTEMEKYHRLLPSAQNVIFEDKGHFNQETFPELVALIQSIKAKS